MCYHSFDINVYAFLPHLVLSRYHPRRFLLPGTDEEARPSSITVMLSKSCGAVHVPWRIHPTVLLSKAFTCSSPVSRGFDYVFLVEGAMGVTSVRLTEVDPTVYKTMRNSAHETPDGEGHQEALLHLTLDGLLPANQTLVVNPSIRTATLFSHAPDGEAHIVAQQHFSPNGMRVL